VQFLDTPDKIRLLHRVLRVRPIPCSCQLQGTNRLSSDSDVVRAAKIQTLGCSRTRVKNDCRALNEAASNHLVRTWHRTGRLPVLTRMPETTKLRRSSKDKIRQPGDLPKVSGFVKVATVGGD